MTGRRRRQVKVVVCNVGSYEDGRKDLSTVPEQSNGTWGRCIYVSDGADDESSREVDTDNRTYVSRVCVCGNGENGRFFNAS